MTRTDMINTIRAGYPLGHKTTQAIADELELLGNHLKSCMLQIQEQEEQLRGLGAELVESEQHRRILATQNAELLARCDLLEAELAQAKALREEAKIGVYQAMFTLSQVGEELTQQ